MAKLPLVYCLHVAVGWGRGGAKCVCACGAMDVRTRVRVDCSPDWTERNDGRGEKAGPPAGAGRTGERGGQAASHRTEGRTAGSEVSQHGQMDEGIYRLMNGRY